MESESTLFPFNPNLTVTKKDKKIENAQKISTTAQLGESFEKKWKRIFDFTVGPIGEIYENQTIRNISDLVEYDVLILLKKTIDKTKLLPECIEILDQLPQTLSPGLIIFEAKANLFENDNKQNPKLNSKVVNDINSKLTNFFWPIFCRDYSAKISEFCSIQARTVPIYFICVINGRDPNLLPHEKNKFIQSLELSSERVDRNYIDKLDKDKILKLNTRDKMDLLGDFYIGIFYCSHVLAEEMVNKFEKEEKDRLEKENKELKSMRSITRRITFQFFFLSTVIFIFVLN